MRLQNGVADGEAEARAVTLGRVEGIEDPLPVILWNAIGAALVATLLYAKLKYGR